jgi:molybdopterin-dependent oxidoreductase alpha subunit
MSSPQNGPTSGSHREYKAGTSNHQGRSTSNRHEQAKGTVAGAQPPADEAIQKERTEVAAGIPAVIETLRFAWGKMGLIRGTKELLEVNKIRGFDCQSCAWPSPDSHRHIAEFCENGAKAVSDEGTRSKVGPAFFRRYGISELLAKSDFWLNRQGRLVQPMILRESAPHYEPVSWDAAFSLIAQELNALEWPDEAAFYTSGRTSNEAAYVYQLFVRQFGTNNLPDCSNMCHESSGAALTETIGVGKGSVTLHDFEEVDAIFIAGQNPGTNHPRMLTTLQDAKRRGAKIVSINPLPEPGLIRFKNPQDFKNPVQGLMTALGKGTPIADLWIPVKIGGDLAFFQGINKSLLERERRVPGTILDHDFIGTYTAGFAEFVAALEQTPWEAILAGSGVSRQQVEAAADLACRSKNIIVCWAMGLTQHRHAVPTIREVVNFLLLRGNIGRPGAGVCPVRGHSNVQGDRTMGIWARMPDAFLEKLTDRYSFNPPRKHGVDTVECIKQMHDGMIKVFFAMGGNFLSATPDTEYTAEALRQCRLTVHVSTKLNRAHLITGKQALILPCLGRSEIDQQSSGPQFVTVEDSMGIINPSHGRNPPASAQLLSEPAIVARLARAVLGRRSNVPWEQWEADYALIRNEIAAIIPGFDQFNERIARGVFYLPHLARDKREFHTATSKANFTRNELPKFILEPDQFVLTTIRSHDQFNTTIYGLDDRYRGIYNGRRVLFNTEGDMKAAGLQQGQPVDITSHFQGQERLAKRFLIAPYPIPRGCVATYFPEGNVLVPIGSVAEFSNTPTSKSIIVTLAPSPEVEAAVEEIRRERLLGGPQSVLSRSEE